MTHDSRQAIPDSGCAGQGGGGDRSGLLWPQPGGRRLGERLRLPRQGPLTGGDRPPRSGVSLPRCPPAGEGRSSGGAGGPAVRQLPDLPQARARLT